MFRTEDAKSDRPLRSITSARGADAGVGSPHDWLDELLASHEVSACVIEVCRNAGQIDYLFQAASPAFGRSTGLTDVVGRSMRALRPDHEEFWFELFQRVATTGEPACFEHVASALDRRFRGHAFRIGGPDSSRVVVIFAVTLDTGREGLERFGATLAHELRSPLASIGNGVRALKRIVLPQDSSGQWTVSMLERQITRLGGLIDDMLDIGRLGSTDVRLHRESVDLHHVISESIEACGALVDEKRHEVSIESDGAALQVRADVRRLVQVFSNLLTNSIKYTAAGGHIRIRLFRENGMAVAQVSDDGMGISSDDLPHVFDLYRQAAQHGSRVESGLGIGLSIVRSIVRLHGGSVTASSDGRQRGSVFTVRLPLVT